MIEKRANGTYRVRIYHRSRYVASRTFRRLTDARTWERAQTDALDAGSWVTPRASGLTVVELLDQWHTARRPTKESSSARIKGLIVNHLVPAFGRRPVSNVAPSEVAAWANRLAADRSASTARQAVGVLRQAYKMAVSDGIVARNPAQGIRLPRTARNEPRPLTHAELWSLAEVMPAERDRLMVLVMGYGGLRWGEVAGLTIRSVRPAALRLTESIAEVGGGLVRGPLKDWEARTIPLPRTVHTDVVRWSKDRDHEILFPSTRNTPLRNSNWRRNWFDPAVSALGLDITPHNLRDTAASLAIATGATVVAVARLLGHEDASTTLRHYAGMFPDDLDSIARRMDKDARKQAERYRRGR